MNILAIIPARSMSKGITNKNIRLLNGKPLLAYSVEQALKSKYINRVIISTDSPMYAKIAEKYGAEAPFLRPSRIAGDLSTDLEVFQHALNSLKKHESYSPEICVHLRPTYPIRKVKDIDAMIGILIKNRNIDSVRSVVLSPLTPFKMWYRDKNGFLSPVAISKIREAYNNPRQLLPGTYMQNACIDVIRSKVILEKKSMTGKRIFGYVMDDFFDIDTAEDLRKARGYRKNAGDGA